MAIMANHMVMYFLPEKCNFKNDLLDGTADFNPDSNFQLGCFYLCNYNQNSVKINGSNFRSSAKPVNVKFN